jgi:hypothetical protein
VIAVVVSRHIIDVPDSVARSLDHDDVINVRWAHENTNPRFQQPDEEEGRAKRAAAAIAATNPALQAYARVRRTPCASRRHAADV